MIDTIPFLIAKRPPPGQILYDTPGTYSFIVPRRIYLVSVVLWGAGGGGLNSHDADPEYYAIQGGGGGGCAWKNDIEVVPQQAITVVVGAAYANGRWSGAYPNYPDEPLDGEPSYFGSMDFRADGGFGCGDYHNSYNTGGGIGGDGNFSGGARSTMVYVSEYGSKIQGGGGAGTTENGGAAPALSDGAGNPGYGRGGCSDGTDNLIGANLGGAVRVMWGNNRAYPSTNIEDM